jgi:hypothetical protein
MDEQAGPVFRLIYRSHSLIPSARRRAGWGEIFATARRNNRRLGVTGALMTSEDTFVQTLEGEEDAVRDLYATIGRDDRHHDVTLLREEVVDDRTFGRWSMARVSGDGGADIRLLSNAVKGVIVEVGEGGDATADQEDVLSFMRSSLDFHHA